MWNSSFEMSRHNRPRWLLSNEMAFSYGSINAVCFPGSWLDSTRLVSLLVFLTRKRLIKDQAWSQGDSCTLCFHFIPTPSQKAAWKIKGQATGTLAHYFSFLFLSLFMAGKGSFQHLGSLCTRLCRRETEALRPRTLIQTPALLGPNDSLWIKLMREENNCGCWVLCHLYIAFATEGS